MAAVITVKFNIPAFDCTVVTTPQMYNKVTNLSNVDIFFKWALEVYATVLPKIN